MYDLEKLKQFEKWADEKAVSETFPDPATMTAKELAEWQYQLQNTHAAIKKLNSEIGKFYDSVRKRWLPETMESEGLESARYGFGTVSLRGDAYAGIRSGMQEEAFIWLEQNDQADLIKSTVNASSLKAMLKARFSAGEEIPDDLFKFEPFTMSAITKR
jgi:hypothetical protein